MGSEAGGQDEADTTEDLAVEDQWVDEVWIHGSAARARWVDLRLAARAKGRAAQKLNEWLVRWPPEGGLPPDMEVHSKSLAARREPGGG